MKVPLRRVVLTIATFACAIMAIVMPGSAQEPSEAEKVLKVMTIERQPFTIISQDEYTGFSIDLWKALAGQLGLKYEFSKSANFGEMLAAVREGRADAAIANISITAGRETTMDFSQPIFDSGLQIMVPTDSPASSIASALFTWDMFGLLAMGGFVLFLAGSLMWYFERRAQPYFETPYKEGAWRSFWWALIVVVNGGFEERIPSSWPGRFFAVVLVVSSLFVVSIFVAKITATLTVGELRSNIQTLTDLHGKRVGTTTGSTTASYLKSRLIRFTEFDNIAELFQSLEDGELDAVVHDAPILAYYAETGGKGRVRTTGAVFRPEKYGIALAQGSPLVEALNRALLRLQEDGAYRELIIKWFGDNYQ